MPKSQPFVFISHFESALNLAQNFEQSVKEKQIKVFRHDHTQIWGDTIPQAVIDALNKTTHLVIFVSSHSEHSAWLAFEMGYVMAKAESILIYQTQPNDQTLTFFDRCSKIRGLNQLDAFVSEVSQLAEGGSKPSDIVENPSREMKAALKNIRSKSQLTRQQALETLVALNAGNELTKLLVDKNAEVRQSAAEGVSKLRFSDAIPLLIEGLEETGKRKKEPLIHKAEEALGAYGEIAFDALFMRLLENVGKDTLIKGDHRWKLALAYSMTTDRANNAMKICLQKFDTFKDDRLLRWMEIVIHAVILSEKNIDPILISDAIKKYLSRCCHPLADRVELARLIAKKMKTLPNEVIEMVADWARTSVSRYEYDKREFSYGGSPFHVVELSKIAIQMKLLTDDDLFAIANTATLPDLKDRFSELLSNQLNWE